jgi:hypothetical protein
MKKVALAIVIVATLAVALMSTGYVFAQSNTPVGPKTPGTGTGYGRGMMGGGMMGGRGAGMTAWDGILHDGMVAVYAEKLGISVADLNARIEKGETMAQIAAEKGLTSEQFTAMMKDARSQAIDQAIKAGTLTQEQADWLKTRGASFGTTGTRGGRGGMRGAGMGTADCPYFPQTNQ